MSDEEEEEYTQSDLSDYLGVSTSTLLRWRRKGIGPAYTTENGFVGYPVSEVRKWVKARKEAE